MGWNHQLDYVIYYYVSLVNVWPIIHKKMKHAHQTLLGGIHRMISREVENNPLDSRRFLLETIKTSRANC